MEDVALVVRDVRKVSVRISSARGGVLMPLCRIFTVALLLAAVGAASYGQAATKMVMVTQPMPAIDVGPNPKNFQLMVMFMSPLDNPTRIFTRFANIKNTDFRIEKMTGPFDGAEFKTVVQPVTGEVQHSLTIDDAGDKGIMKDGKISFTLLVVAPMGSMFETRDTNPNPDSPSKDFRIQNKSTSVDVDISKIMLTTTQVPEPASLVTLSGGLCLLAARRRRWRRSAGKRTEGFVRR